MAAGNFLLEHGLDGLEKAECGLKLRTGEKSMGQLLKDICVSETYDGNPVKTSQLHAVNKPVQHVSKPA